MSNNKYKVLIIEDEQNINNLLDTLMQANGYQTIIATCCGSGLMMYASHRPDIVILDLGLPDKDGINPKMLFNNVVFPIPFVPTSAIFCPRSILKFNGFDNGSSYPVTRSCVSNNIFPGVRP